MMAGENDILGKADALLRRHALSIPGADTAGVPVLTDLIDEPEQQAAHEDVAREVFTRIMAEVEGRLATDLEKRLLHHLVPQVHAAVASALGDLHQELANAIGDAVAEALARRQVK
jgi:hypothetical protein